MSGRASVFHIVAGSDWDTALISGTYAPGSLVDEGFVHLSYAGQVTATANRYYRDLDGLVVVELDPGLLDGSVVEEDLTGSGERYPHVYAAIPTAAAIAVHSLARGADGDFVF